MSGDLVEIFVVLLMILAAPPVSKLLRVPVIVVEILLGMALGPSLLGLLREEAWLSAMATMGFIYLMFVVGLETDVGLIRRELGRVVAVALGSFLAPLALGYAVALRYGLPPELIGVALSTTSMGVVLPTVREFPGRREVAQVLLGAAILVDVLSMFALAYVVERGVLSPGRILLLLASIAASLLAVRLLKIHRPLVEALSSLVGEHHLDVRLAIALIFGFAVLAEVVGVHAILGSFFAGLLMSEFEEDAEYLLEKLLSFGYGFFIPVFFIAVGVRTDLGSILGNLRGLEVLASLALAGFAGKILGTYAASRVSGFTDRESLSMGLAMSARLSLIVAAAELGLAAGLIDLAAYSMLVLLAVVSVVLSPSLARLVVGGEVAAPTGEAPL